eukprot:166119-Hanusia_phi.AAC.1
MLPRYHPNPGHRLPSRRRSCRLALAPGRRPAAASDPMIRDPDPGGAGDLGRSGDSVRSPAE